MCTQVYHVFKQIRISKCYAWIHNSSQLCCHCLAHFTCHPRSEAAMEILWAVDVSRPKLTDTEKQMQIMVVSIALWQESNFYWHSWIIIGRYILSSYNYLGHQLALCESYWYLGTTINYIIVTGNARFVSI